MELLVDNWRRITIVGLLLVGIVAGVYLSLHPQVFKGRANIQAADKLSGQNVQRLSPQDLSEMGLNENTPTFKVNGSDFTVHYNP